MMSKNFGCTGDVFLALFILDYFYKNKSLKLAADQTFSLVENTIVKTSDSLMIYL